MGVRREARGGPLPPWPALTGQKKNVFRHYRENVMFLGQILPSPRKKPTDANVKNKNKFIIANAFIKNLVITKLDHNELG